MYFELILFLLYVWL